MIIPPLIQLLHASDAPQHVSALKAILVRMKYENRISDFIPYDITNSPFPLAIKNGDPQGIIILLTFGVEQGRAELEKSIRNINLEKEQIKLIEIIVDNLTYHDTFISFPRDLKPIRARDDMNQVWKGIEQDLTEIFPTPAEPIFDPTQIKTTGVSLFSYVVEFIKKILKFFGTLLYILLSALFWAAVLIPTGIAPGYLFLVPTIITAIFIIVIRRRKRAKTSP